ncbi:hypothetical protein [Yinghuangia seranimata]|uniref:hypothetical protein n=1 Tax=Yinghuangia seranimata TaxID=408067 RepID=UPI00248D034A|nr:hypothetical protein [Yinghuangia seranimata]MDI2128363.1 hypothetical protein [Yinghuangia seranimata]
MTPEQLAALERIIQLLSRLVVDLNVVAEGMASPGAVPEARGRYAELDAALTTLVSSVEASTDDGIECAVLKAVRRMLAEGVGSRLTPSSGQAPAAPAWHAMEMACRLEEKSLRRLFDVGGKPVLPAAEQVGPAKGMMHRTCLVAGNTVQVEDRKPVELCEFSMSLLALRERGVKRVFFDNAATVPAIELKWLCNVAAELFDANYRQFGRVLNAPVAIPDAGKTLFTHFTFHVSCTLRIRWEEYQIRPTATFGETVEQLKARLIQTFKLAGVREDGRVWKADELVQLFNALTKIPVADQKVLRGCTVIRKPTPTAEQKKAALAQAKATATTKVGAPVEEPEDEGDESAHYNVYSHSIAMLDGCFPSEDFGFVGVGAALAPYSHWVIIHEVGHAVELRDWKLEYDKLGPAALEAELDDVQARKKAANAWLAGPGQSAPIPEYRTKSQESIELGKKESELLGKIGDCHIAQAKMGSSRRANTSSSACLRLFTTKVKALHVDPFTPYAYDKWATKPGEFFAEAYTMYLNEPHILAYISADLFAWFEEGRYRV